MRVNWFKAEAKNDRYFEKRCDNSLLLDHIGLGVFGGGSVKRSASRNTGVQIDHRPVRLLNVYRETGGTPLPQRSKERQNYRFEEMKRWRDRLNMPLILEPTGFPHPDELASCLVYALKSTGADVGQLSARIMTALWAEDKDISNPDVLTSICDELGLDAQALLQIARHKDTIAHYDANTQSAIKDGVFGSPFYIYKGQRFWGQDRLDFLEELVVRHV